LQKRGENKGSRLPYIANRIDGAKGVVGCAEGLGGVVREMAKVPDDIKDSLIKDIINSYERLPDDIRELIRYSEYVDLLYSFLLDEQDPAVKDLIVKLKRNNILCGNALEGLSKCVWVTY
jgi:hypothetical protein